MEYTFGVYVGDCLDYLLDVVLDVLFSHLVHFLQPLLQVLSGNTVTPSEQYSMKMYWKLSSSNQ